MLKKMKWRFILSAMAAMTAVVAVLLAVVNLWNYKETTRRVDQILAAVMDAEQTGGEPFAGRDFPPETSFTARFFSVRTDGTEERTEVILDNISSVSEEEAREYAREVLEEGKNSGYYKSYRYRAEEQEGETTLLFLDVSNELQFIQTLLFSSCIVAAASLLSVFGLLAIFSGRAVAPYARNIERQKQFITDAGHEIKTPLTSISTSADVLAMEQEDNEWVRNIKKQSARLSRLVTDLVTLSRLDEERPIPEPVRFSVSDTAWEIAEPFAALARAKEKRFSCSIEEELYMTGDQGVIQQMFSILLDNAVRYSDEKGTIYFHVYGRRKYVEAEIFNTCSLKADLDVERLFDRFYRPDRSRNAHTGGTGIGLSIARAAAEAHGGTIRAECRNHSSLLFHVTLPVMFKEK
ncbi:MAG TPA: HAMP domain-containing histidine kinase [Firmicutes bacterium]|nr:HAMP domain-containing histidine kinase [Bacillota bacterium]